MKPVVRFGLDLAKRSFSVAGADAHSNIILRETLKRHQLLPFFVQRPPAMVAMESGSGAHHWARELISLGHDARIIDPRRVAPYRPQGRTGKNDINDAIAICEAASRPNMRFVPVKSIEQQTILTVHRLRHAAVVTHTQTINRMRGLLAEFGVVVPRGADTFKRRWRELRIDPDPNIPQLTWQVLDELFDELHQIHRKILGYDRQIRQFVKNDERAIRLLTIHGIGEKTAAAIVAMIGNGRDFKNGRQFAAWVGLTPRQYTTGGKPRLGGITKRGDTYLRTLLIHGARSVLVRAATRDDSTSRWASNLLKRKSWNQAAVAVANKNARMAWAVLAKSD